MSYCGDFSHLVDDVISVFDLSNLKDVSRKQEVWSTTFKFQVSIYLHLAKFCRVLRKKSFILKMFTFMFITLWKRFSSFIQNGLLLSVGTQETVSVSAALKVIDTSVFCGLKLGGLMVMSPASKYIKPRSIWLRISCCKTQNILVFVILSSNSNMLDCTCVNLVFVCFQKF